MAHRAIGPYPGDIRHLQARLLQHAERPIETAIPDIWHCAAVGDQLDFRGAAADIWNNQISGFALCDERQKLEIKPRAPDTVAFQKDE